MQKKKEGSFAKKFDELAKVKEKKDEKEKEKEEKRKKKFL